MHKRTDFINYRKRTREKKDRQKKNLLCIVYAKIILRIILGTDGF